MFQEEIVTLHHPNSSELTGSATFLMLIYLLAERVSLMAELVEYWATSKKYLQLATRFMFEGLLAAQPHPKGRAAFAVAKEGDQSWARSQVVIRGYLGVKGNAFLDPSSFGSIGVSPDHTHHHPKLQILAQKSKKNYGISAIQRLVFPESSLFTE